MNKDDARGTTLARLRNGGAVPDWYQMLTTGLFEPFATVIQQDVPGKGMVPFWPCPHADKKGGF